LILVNVDYLGLRSMLMVLFFQVCFLTNLFELFFISHVKYVRATLEGRV